MDAQYTPSNFYTQHAMSHYNTMNFQATELKKLLQTPQAGRQQETLSPNGTFRCYDQTPSTINKNGSSCTKTPSQVRIRRPLNCFMVFSHLERKRVAEEHPELHNADLSKILGKRWKSLTAIQRQPYVEEAERMRQLHTEIYPDYKYQPRRKFQGRKMQRKSYERSSSIDDQKLAKKENFIKTKESLLKDQHVNPQNNPMDSQIKTSILSNIGPQVGNHNSNQLVSSTDTNKLYYNQYARYFSGQMPTSNLTSESYYNEFSYDVPTTSQSFPPTPELSPTQMGHDESMFTFDANTFHRDYVQPSLIKSTNYTSPSYNDTKNNFFEKINYGNVTNQNSFFDNQEQVYQRDAFSETFNGYNNGMYDP